MCGRGRGAGPREVVPEAVRSPTLRVPNDGD